MPGKDWHLCYCDGSWAWFTTAPLDQQWGDDWNDAPWEHNAGEPYEWREYMEERGVEPYELMRVAWDGPYELPGAWDLNSGYSVQDMNELRVPWLSKARWYTPSENITVDPVWAGVNVEEFTRLVKQAGGRVYMEVEGD